jgi:hypothetical protein
MVALLVQLLVPLEVLSLLHVVLVLPILVLSLGFDLVFKVLLLLRDVLVSKGFLLVLITSVLAQVLVLV